MAWDPLVAVEIGTSKVCALVGEAREDGLILITGLGVCPSRGCVRKGLILDLEKAAACVKRAIEDAEQTSRVEIGKVYLTVAGGHVRCLHSQGSVPVLDVRAGITPEDMEQVKDVARAVNLPHDRELMHSIPCHYLVDDQPFVNNPRGMRGAKLALDMLLVHGARTALANAIQAVQGLGIEVADVAFSGLCAGMAILTPEQKEAGVALVELGAGTTNYLVYAGNAIALAGSLAVGGDHVTNDIAQAFNLSLKRAEQLKQDTGAGHLEPSQHIQELALPAEAGFSACSVSVSDVNTVIRARLDETFRLLARLFREQGLAQRLGAGIVLVGGGVQMKGLLPIAECAFDLPAGIGRPIHFSGLTLAAEGVAYAAPLGMLRYAARSLRRESEPGGLGRLVGSVLGRFWGRT